MGKDDHKDEKRKPFAVKVGDHKYYSAHEDKDTIQDLVKVIEERARHYGHIKKNQHVDRLQLVNQDLSDKGELGHDIRLGDVAIMKGDHGKLLHAVIVTKETEKPKPASPPPKDDVIRCWCCGMGR
eukprot:TRINITY_DN5602_c0_g1_i1.p1 TRINITY_DN5602_c0_g1~~TRINITY_DN5602_c0_g1_i1.p1  ORF type:complete len:126 (+),score=32.96 TRINITY_DN5602_c0_g1_i1:231-608(+)